MSGEAEAEVSGAEVVAALKTNSSESCHVHCSKITRLTSYRLCSSATCT